ncbi:MAG: TatD family hydrolase [Saprospiraceae bacterium]|nr:TatD family hydrolase [Saprospiraceae bacterium]
MWIDTHCHLYLKQFDEDREEMVKRAISNDVRHMFLPDIDSSTTGRLDDLISSYPANCHRISGLHPCSVKDNYEDELAHVQERLFGREDVVAVGETGLDYYWDKSHIDEQQRAFERQIEWARELELPIIIHSRDSLDETIGTIEKMTRGDLRGIFHCFNGTEAQAKRIMDIGFHMGLGGVVTFKNADLDGVVKLISDESFLLETDAPYLAPVPHRGKRNESAYIPVIGEYVAKVRKCPVDEVARITTANALELFDIEI